MTLSSSFSLFLNSAPSTFGSSAYTSRAAPAIFFSFSALYKACSSTLAPLDVLIRYAVGFFHSLRCLGLWRKVQFLSASLFSTRHFLMIDALGEHFLKHPTLSRELILQPRLCFHKARTSR